MPPSQADRVRHILTAIAELERALAGKVYADLVADVVLCAAVERFLERMSEASRYIPDATKEAESSINWAQLADLGNRLRHAYHSVDPEIVWRIATTQIGPLKVIVERIIREEKP